MRRRSRSGTWPWETPPGRRGTTGAVGGDVTQVVPYILPSAPEPHPEDRTDRCPRRPGVFFANCRLISWAVRLCFLLGFGIRAPADAAPSECTLPVSRMYQRPQSRESCLKSISHGGP